MACASAPPDTWFLYVSDLSSRRFLIDTDVVFIVLPPSTVEPPLIPHQVLLAADMQHEGPHGPTDNTASHLT